MLSVTGVLVLLVIFVGLENLSRTNAEIRADKEAVRRSRASAKWRAQLKAQHKAEQERREEEWHRDGTIAAFERCTGETWAERKRRLEAQRLSQEYGPDFSMEEVELLERGREERLKSQKVWWRVLLFGQPY